MLSQSQRTTILELSAAGKNKREIARLLNLSRQSVRKVLAMKATAVPKIARDEKAAPHRQRILELLPACKGNLVRVHEELTADGVTMSYQTLTAFCRRQGIGQAPIVPTGSYDHQCLPGVEMQHDTSPHDVTVAGREYKAQTASAVLGYSRLLYFEIWPQFQRFDCKAFLTAALRYMDGAPQRVMIDNTHVVVLRGSGKQMEPVPEMAVFGQRFGFRFEAHEIGDVLLSGRPDVRQLAGPQQPGAPVV